MVDNTLNFLLESKLIAVFRSSEPAISIDFAKACIDGGIKSIEVVLDSPESFNLISELCGLNDILIGAGTVLNVDDALRAIESGAKFIVSPHTDKDIISVARSNKTVVVSGAFTSSEIVVAWKLGAHLVKIFPASANGPNYIKALKEPLPFINIMVTGGINLTNIVDYIRSGATVVGVSSCLTGKNNEFDYKIVRKNASSLVKTLQMI